MHDAHRAAQRTATRPAASTRAAAHYLLKARVRYAASNSFRLRQPPPKIICDKRGFWRAASLVLRIHSVCAHTARGARARCARDGNDDHDDVDDDDAADGTALARRKSRYRLQRSTCLRVQQQQISRASRQTIFEPSAWSVLALDTCCCCCYYYSCFDCLLPAKQAAV